MPPIEPLLTVRDVAAYLACAEGTVKRLVRRQLLPATRVGNRLRFTRTDVEAYRLKYRSPVQEQTSAATYLARLQLITGVFSQPQTPAEAAQLLVTQCVHSLDATNGMILLVRDHATLELVYALGYPQEALEPWRRLPLAAELPLPTVVRRGEPAFYESKAALVAHYPALANAMTTSGAWAIIPLPIHDRVLGGIVLGFAAPREFTRDDRAFLFALAQQCAQAIDRARLYEETLAVENARLYQQAQQQRARVQALADASRVFAEARLDTTTVVNRVAQHIGTILGDNCTIRLLSIDGRQLELAAVYHPQPEAQALLYELATAEAHMIHEGLTGRVFQSGQPFYLPVVDPVEIRSVLKPVYHPYVDRFGITSILAVPLRASGSIIGTLFISRDQPGRPYTTDDQTLLQEIADRAAIAIENARLYEAEQLARAAAEQAATRTAILQKVTTALSNPYTLEEIADIVVTSGMMAVGAVAGTISLLNDDGTFSIIRMINYPSPVNDEWRGRRYAATVGAPIPDAVHLRTPIWLESTEAIMARYPNLAGVLPASHLGAWGTVPLMVEERVYGGCTFLFPTPQAFTADDRAFILALAQQCAQAVERVRLRIAEAQALAEIDASRQRQTMLAEASAELAASFEIQATLESLAHLVVPRLADWCVIDMQADDGTIQTAVIAHTDPEKEQIAWRIVRRFPIDPEAPAGTAAVLRTRQPELVPDITDEFLAVVAVDAEHYQMLSALAIRSTLCVPLIARGRALGTIALVAAESGRHYSEADLPFLEDLARRAALAIDNARLYREARDAVELRDTFFSVAAHELKTPLTSLLGQGQLLLRRAKRDNSLTTRDQQAVQIMVNQAARLNRMILTMLDSTRLEHGQLSIEQAVVDLAALTNQAVAELQPTTDRHTIQVSATGQPLTVLGDVLRLEQVIQNLIGNAIKYSPNGGPVIVRLVQEDAFARIEIQDSGIGIPASALPQLFQRFYRAQNASAQHISGMGIGLYVVKEIIGLHGGLVQVTSVENEGTRFIIKLPLLKQHHEE